MLAIAPGRESIAQDFKRVLRQLFKYWPLHHGRESIAQDFKQVALTFVSVICLKRSRNYSISESRGAPLS